MTPPAAGAQSSVKFLAIADLGHAQLDGSEEVSLSHIHSNETYGNNLTLEQARFREPCFFSYEQWGVQLWL